jgi:hypothetical protein
VAQICKYIGFSHLRVIYFNIFLILQDLAYLGLFIYFILLLLGGGGEDIVDLNKCHDGK